MRTTRSLKLLFVFIALVFTGAFFIFEVFGNYIFSVNAIDNTRVYFFDIGQGDSSLIKTKYGQNILIDGGEDEGVVRELDKVLSWYDKTLDLVILTHPHNDHVSGLIPVLKQYRVEKVLYTGVSHTAPSYLEWLKLIGDKQIDLIIINHPQTINFGNDVKLEIVYPFDDLSGQSVTDLNNSSIVARYIEGGESILFMGDIEMEIEKELIMKNKDIKSNIVKVGHHGSDTSSSQEFIDYVKPQIAVVSVGKDNKFGHPSLRVIKRYKKAGITVYRTDLDGTVSFEIGYR